jgi:signal transduction histidine kinase/CheY-like chemotaxis protein
MPHPKEAAASQYPVSEGAARIKKVDMCDLVAEFDWSLTSIGAYEDWPSSLKATVRLIMDSVEPMVVWWGDESLQIYNDAYAPRVGSEEGATALGMPASVSWKHGWESVRPLVRLLLDGGPSTIYRDFLYPIERDGSVEDTFWTYSLTPVRDDDGQVGGVLLLSEDTTQRNLAIRRQQTLDLLRGELSNVNSADELRRAVDQAVTFNPRDVSRALIVSPRQTQSVQKGTSAMVLIKAPDMGIDVDLGIEFQLPPRVALNASYERFLAEFTLLVASARHRIDSELRRLVVEAERDRLLLDAPVGAAVMIGEDLVYHLVNAIYSTVSGRPVESMVGRPFVEVFPELNGSPVHEQFKAVYRAGHPFISQPTLVQIHRHGEALDDRYFTYNLSPLRTLEGEVYGLMVIAVDITVEVESRSQVEELNTELQAAARAKDEFLALLGHELRNPLSPIVTALDLMRMRDKTTEREQVIIRRQVNHLTRLVDDLLDVSRITRGKVELRYEVVDARDVINSAVEMVMPLVAQRQQKLTVDVVSVKWYGDPARLAQIVSNLLTNASRYSQTAAQINLRVDANDSELKIAVTDNGMGLSKELLPRIFEPFIQGERQVRGAVGGLGIGLALVKNLSELHGGQAVAYSEGPGQGSVFTVNLPLVPVPRTYVPSAAILPSSPQPTHQRILVVDDNEDAADTLAEALRSYGHTVSVAYTPRSALEIFASQNVDLAILDIGLPEMTGHELATAMRENGRNPGVRYAALTGFGQDADRERSAAAGFVTHLVKPLKLEDLEALLAAFT